MYRTPPKSSMLCCSIEVIITLFGYQDAMPCQTFRAWCMQPLHGQACNIYLQSHQRSGSCSRWERSIDGHELPTRQVRKTFGSSPTCLCLSSKCSRAALTCTRVRSHQAGAAVTTKAVHNYHCLSSYCQRVSQVILLNKQAANHVETPCRQR